MADDKNLNEEQMESEEKYSFLKETFKDEQVTGKKIGRAVLQMVGKGLVFGLAACLAFYAFAPWIQGKFVNENTEISIPDDEEVAVSEETAEVEEETVTLTVENYREMNKALNEVAQEARRCVVEISVKDESTDWTEEAENEIVSGLVVWNNGFEIFILAPYGTLPESDVYRIKFVNGMEYEAYKKWQDSNLQFRIYAVNRQSISKATMSRMSIAKWGNSNILLKGDPVISLGMQFGYSDGLGYGVVSSKDHKISIADYQYPIITTDIAMASGGSGVLFNINGEVVGLIDQRTTNAISADVVSGYAISQIKDVIECLSNGRSIPYLGVMGIEVTEEISEKEGIPVGIYVKEVEAESPAMQAGIQSGDIIVKMNDTEIKTLNGYSKKLKEFSRESTVKVTVKRLGAEEYEEVVLDAVVGVKN